jgi:hypothetical protein
VGAALLLQYEMLADVAYGSKADMAAQILMSAIIGDVPSFVELGGTSVAC